MPNCISFTVLLTEKEAIFSSIYYQIKKIGGKFDLLSSKNCTTLLCVIGPSLGGGIDDIRRPRFALPQARPACSLHGYAHYEAQHSNVFHSRINVKDHSLDISFEEWRDYLLFHPSADLADIIASWRHNTVMIRI